MCWQQKKIISVELSILRVTVRDEVRDREREREREKFLLEKSKEIMKGIEIVFVPLLSGFFQ